MSASIKKLSDVITDVDDGRLVIRPFFQRRLVWTNVNKESLIDTVLKDYPFPEVFIATGQLDLKTGKRVTWLVDGQQRISTLRAYVKGSQDLLYKQVSPFDALSEKEQESFFDYDVIVRDLGTIPEATIREIFRRINSTDYALKSMEVLNAMFSGAYKGYCESLSRSDFFESHKTFPEASKKRMYDITFCVILVTTVLSGYYRRDELNAKYLEMYNDEFPQQDEIQTGFDRVFDFIDTCRFRPSCRAWKQTDLFTLLVELYALLVTQKADLDATLVREQLEPFYDSVDDLYASSTGDVASSPDVLKYLKAATKATNDKYARQDRAQIISDLLIGATTEKRDLTSPASKAKNRRANQNDSTQSKSQPNPDVVLAAPKSKKARKSTSGGGSSDTNVQPKAPRKARKSRVN